MAILIAIFCPLLAALILPLVGRWMGPRTGWVALAFAIVSASSTIMLIPLADDVVEFSWPWVPSLGLSLNFLVDGLSVFYGLVVSIMGVLVMFYASYYLDGHYREHGRFYAYLSFFMFAMMGTVFAGNLLLLFIFWELTGIASFLLIGFNHEKEESRAGARMALLVTGGTGLVMLAGIVLLYLISGTLNLLELMYHPPVEAKRFLNVAMLLTMVGAFGKSAQLPFQFWLPNAMAAPTPASAYLHSATMVKLGVFLCGRTFPFFHLSDWWMPLLSIVAFGTMFLAAVLAFLAVDLKGILAWSTVCQLGFLIGYYGMAPPAGVDFDYLHILNHVFYKGCLFMVVGIVDHCCGSRDIRFVRGLWKQARLLGWICLIACASMAGLPGTTGFVSKEYMLKEVFGSFGDHTYLGFYALVLVILMSLMKVAFSARLFHGIFLGDESKVVEKHYHRPPAGMLVPPLLLAVLAVIFGVYPQLLGSALAIFEVSGLQNRAHGDLHLWHGVTRELLTSAALVLGGVAFYWIAFRRHLNNHKIPAWLQFDIAFTRGLAAFAGLTRRVTRLLQADNPLLYLPVVVAFTAIVPGAFLLNWLGPGAGEALESTGANPLRAAVATLIGAGVLGTILLRRWTTQLISLSVSGFLISFYYVLYRAPDLALTQLLVETVTLILVLLLLNRFPRSAEAGARADRPSPLMRFVNATLSIGVGLVMTVLVLLFSGRVPDPSVGDLVLDQTVPLAAGSNAVNTILVDFRGLDTLGEIAVLLITTLGCLGLLMRHKRTKEEYRSGPLGPAGFGIDHGGREDRR